MGTSVSWNGPLRQVDHEGELATAVDAVIRVMQRHADPKR
jgi:hypothetical protein